jgi:hypothetical protein
VKAKDFGNIYGWYSWDRTSAAAIGGKQAKELVRHFRA